MRSRIRPAVLAVARALGGAFLGGFVLVVMTILYFMVMPGSWFLHSTSPVKVVDALVGDDIPFQWCRQPTFGLIKAEATRSFYRADSDGKFRPVAQPTGEYRFSLAVEETDGCQELTLLAKRQPQEEGTYKFYTDLTWREQGFEKHLRYESEPYVLGATVESLQREKARLEKRVQELTTQIDRLEAKTPTTSAAPATPVEQAPATNTVKQPTTSAPPDPGVATPSPVTQPSQPGGLGQLIRPTLDVVTDTLSNTVKGLGL